MKKLILLISFILISGNLFGIDEKAEMKKLILKIRGESPENFIIIPQNGTEIACTSDRSSIDKNVFILKAEAE